MKKIFLPIILILAFSGCQKDSININESLRNISESKNEYMAEIKKTSDNAIQAKEFSSAIDHQVGFACQFPTGNMDDPYQEACEETSIIMAKAFVDNLETNILDNLYIDESIRALVDWQIREWGGHYDINTERTLELFKNFYHINNGEVVTIDTINDLKAILSNGNIIIAPTYGMNLSNPYFTAPGPAYHMLIIKGYDEENFITNDPGIGLGKNFKYTFKNLFESIFDLPDKANMKSGYIKNNPDIMKTGAKKIIVINK